ncbi:hypothetical protein P7D22_06860 [Lichenihabitans sp. Uapishka_5]|uniref:hypothetical protein n=1 Tax=Lichenihabitans sp. Uapishka_5 TaxID=3037302 RepID=UPI0029E81C7D|nr:hypothetical protein [Lichenihabitans sp. Uapishka_5]MDX7950897.1 hypothetical protein [Lichenihabitans sp. Uapishka_5]
MSLSLVDQSDAASRVGRHALFGPMLAACALAVLVMAPQAWSVASRGTFLDPDDALRTVEIRDFLAGQSWFDMVPHRLSPGHPFAMHWSRLVDAPLAALNWAFGRVMPADAAERAMRIVVPIGLFLLALWAILRITARLAGRAALLPAGLLFASSTELMANFLPGHIHHHGLQAMLLLGAVLALMRVSAPKRVPTPKGQLRHGALAGGLAVVSLGIGLQNLPFVVGITGVVLGLWVVRGRPQARGLAGFGLGLMAAVPVFCLDVAPHHYAIVACDAFSIAHVVAAGATAVLCLLLAGLSERLPRPASRAIAVGCGGASIVVGLAWGFPTCLGDPMAGVDPLLRREWLDGVGEALPLSRLIAASWPEGMALLLTLAGGLGATVLATVAARPDRHAGWLGLLVLASIGVAGTLWQVRVAASTAALLVPGSAWLVGQVFERASRRPGRPALLLAVVSGVMLGGSGWSAMAGLGARHGSGAAAAARPADCFDPAAFAGLAALPPGLVLSSIDPGSALLAYTGHTVLAAPYHRNTYGNRLSLLALAALPEASLPMLRQAGVRYLALCRASNETAETVATHPDSLSARLMAGQVPPGLTRLGGDRDTYLIWQVD